MPWSEMDFRVRALWLAAFALLFLAFGARMKGREGAASRLPFYFRLAALSIILTLVTAGSGCNNYFVGDSITLSGTGTPSGNYVIRITGTLGNSSGVTRSTSVNLAVGAG